MNYQQKAKSDLINELITLKSRVAELEAENIVYKQAAPILPESAGLFHSLIQSLPQNIFSKDLEGRFTFANQQYCLTENKVLSNILGKSDFDLHAPELAEKYRADDVRVMQSRQTTHIVEVHQPVDGEKSYVQVIKTPIYNGNHEVVGILGAFWDITDLKEAEETLRQLNHELQSEIEQRTQLSTKLAEERNLLRTLIDNIPDHIYAKDEESRFLLSNISVAEAMGAEIPENLMGRTDFDFHPFELASQYRADEMALMASGQSMINQIEPAVISRNGQKENIWVSATKIPLKDSFSKVIGLVGINRDVTEQIKAAELLREYNQKLEAEVEARTQELKAEKERAEQLRNKAQELRNEAEEANKAKSDFLSNMSHELRTPLNGILGYAQILRRDKELTTKQADGLNIIQQSGEHLLTLINDILDLAKIEAGKMELNPSPVYLALFLESILNVIQMRADQKGIALLYEPLTSLEININVDEKRLRQILLNLLNNAVKFTHNGTVTLRIAHLNELESPGVTHKMEHLRFEVIDTGVGMTAEQLPQIFNPFVQVGDSRKQIEGTGLGLAITRQLIEAMGSQLMVKSDFGHGSIFWFDISLPVSNTSEQKHELERPINGYKGARRKILVVDDKSSNRAVFTTMLEPLGFELYVAENGQQAIEQAQSVRPDLILMDMIMPIMTGFEATQMIRNITELRKIVIIGASASTFEKDIQQVKLAGCDSFLPKPVEFKKLLTLLELYLNLEWDYDEVEVSMLEDVIIDKPKDVLNSMVIPLETELQPLYELALMGDLLTLEDEAIKLQTMNIRYAAFVTQVCRMTADFQVEPVINFLKSYLPEVGHE